MNVISSKTAQQIVDTVKEFCGYDINFINIKRYDTGQHRHLAYRYLP